MKILVTGAAGFLGSWIADKLVDLGHDVVGVDSLIGGDPDNSKECDVVATDMRSSVTLELMGGCNAVYHCAALAYEGLSVFSPSMIADNIVGGTVSVATAAIKSGVRRFINCSSMARYGTYSRPYTEDMVPDPVDPYGAAKVAAERQLNILGKVHGMSVIHAVPHNIYGPRQKYDDPFRNVAAIFVNRLLQGKPPVIYGDGDQVRCFSYIDDVLPTMLALLDADAAHGEVFNVGPEYTFATTVKDLAYLLKDLTGVPLDPVYVDPRPCDVKVALCSSQKIARRFGFEQRTPLRAGMVKLVDYVRDRGPRPFDYHLPVEIDSPILPKTWKERTM